MKPSKLGAVAIRCIHHITMFSAWISSGIVLIIILLVVANVIGRYVFRNPVRGTVEMVELLTVALVFFILAYTEHKKGHVTVEVVVSRLPRRVQAVLGYIAGVFAVVFVAVICWQGVLLVLSRIFPLIETSQTLSIPIFPFLICLVLGSFVFTLELLISCFHPLPPKE